MTIYPTSNVQYSWSLELSSELRLDEDTTIDWLIATTDLIIGTGFGATETFREGSTMFHYLLVPPQFLVGCPQDDELLVLEVTSINEATLAHLRLAASGVEPAADMAVAEVWS